MLLKLNITSLRKESSSRMQISKEMCTIYSGLFLETVILNAIDPQKERAATELQVTSSLET